MHVWLLQLHQQNGLKCFLTCETDCSPNFHEPVFFLIQVKTYIKYRTLGLENLYESIAVLQVLPFVSCLFFFSYLDADKGLSFCFRWGLYILTQVCCASLQVVNVFLFWIILENKNCRFHIVKQNKSTSVRICVSELIF